MSWKIWKVYGEIDVFEDLLLALSWFPRSLIEIKMSQVAASLSFFFFSLPSLNNCYIWIKSHIRFFKSLILVLKTIILEFESCSQEWKRELNCYYAEIQMVIWAKSRPTIMQSFGRLFKEKRLHLLPHRITGK